MFIWVYQNGQIIQHIEDWKYDAGWFADLFPEAIYFYAELCAW